MSIMLATHHNKKLTYHNWKCNYRCKEDKWLNQMNFENQGLPKITKPSTVAATKLTGIRSRSSPIGKFRRDRAVLAPYNLSAGTSMSPKLSLSIRTAAIADKDLTNLHLTILIITTYTCICDEMEGPTKLFMHRYHCTLLQLVTMLKCPLTFTRFVDQPFYSCALFLCSKLQ